MSLRFFTPIQASGSFSPDIIANLVLWLDAQDIATITKDGSNFVSQWNDKSSSANNAVQATGANQPVYNATGLNSLPAITQTGSPQRMTMTAIPLTACTIFVVGVSAESGGSARQGFIGGAASSVEVSPQFSIELYDGIAAALDLTGTDVSANVPFLLEMTAPTNPALGTGSVDGVASTVTFAAGPAWTLLFNTIGARTNGTVWNINGAYGEVLIYSRALSAPETLQVNDYLLTKWGL